MIGDCSQISDQWRHQRQLRPRHVECEHCRQVKTHFDAPHKTQQDKCSLSTQENHLVCRYLGTKTQQPLSRPGAWAYPDMCKFCPDHTLCLEQCCGRLSVISDWCSGGWQWNDILRRPSPLWYVYKVTHRPFSNGYSQLLRHIQPSSTHIYEFCNFNFEIFVAFEFCNFEFAGLWVISSSPLILGFDMLDNAKMTRVWPIITNTEVNTTKHKS